MSQAFIIMQIGNKELDAICEQVMVPALGACGLDPKRVDKHNNGGLLKSEIIKFIEDSDIIVADLTNERPNCYLEVGYTMGIDKLRNLILKARQDHNPDRPNRRSDDPKVHFDLGGYDILYWNPDRLGEFREDLEKRVKRRQAILSPSGNTSATPWDVEWIAQHRATAWSGLLGVKKTPNPGFMEVCFTLSNSKPSKTQRELLEAAKGAQIETFGWPIGVFLDGSDEDRPRPKVDGIVAEIADNERSSYDYWTTRRDGGFYLLQSLFEDQIESGSIFFNTRIVRVTEALLYCARLYARLGIPSTATVNVAVRHGRLRGRHGKAHGSNWPALQLELKQPTTEDDVYAEIVVPLAKIESSLPELVKNLTAPLFMLFDFLEVPDKVYAYIVNKFVEGTPI